MSRHTILRNVALNKSDTLLAELYEAKKWKQAFAHCEKRQKKGERGAIFLVIMMVFFFFCEKFLKPAKYFQLHKLTKFVFHFCGRHSTRLLLG